MCELRWGGAVGQRTEVEGAVAAHAGSAGTMGRTGKKRTGYNGRLVG